MKEAPYALNDGTDDWDEVTIDLSSYAGQQGYIAIHHVSEGMYFLVIDDFGIYGGTWQTPYGSPVSTNSITITGLDDETLYGLTYNTKYFRTGYKGSSYLIAFDINSFDVKWRHQIDCICGFNAEHLKLDGDKLFVLDSGLFCFNKNTGECLFAKKQSDEDLCKEVGLSVPVDQSGIFQYEGKFYYTRNSRVGSNERMRRPEKYNKNIICWDGNTYKLVWSDLPPYEKGASLQTRPVVVNGKCFVVTNTGLRVYDAKTGKFFGVWRDIDNLGWDLNASYENLFVFFDHDTDTGKGILTAINAE